MPCALSELRRTRHTQSPPFLPTLNRKISAVRPGIVLPLFIIRCSPTPQRILFPVSRVTMSEQGRPMNYHCVRGAPEGLAPGGDKSPVQKGSPFKFS